MTALISTAGEPSSGGPQTTFTVNHKPQSNLNEKFKGFVEVTLYNINKGGCTLCWRSLDAVRYLIRYLIDQRPQGKQKFANTNFTWMRIYMLIYLVWIIMFNSWYKHGMGKTRFKNLEFSLWITLKAKLSHQSVPYMNCFLRKAQYRRIMMRNKFKKYGKSSCVDNRRLKNLVVEIRKTLCLNIWKEIFKTR